MAEPLRKAVARVELPLPFQPRYQYVMTHDLGEDVVYSVYDSKSRQEIKIRDVEVGIGFLRFKFEQVPADVKIVVIG